MMVDISKILFVLGLIHVFAKVAGRKATDASDKLYLLHKAGPALSTILGSVHGLTITPISTIRVQTGWLLGIVLLVLFVLGVIMGFTSGWIPYDDAQNKRYRLHRIIKWILTIVVILALDAHYLIL